jgi:hypothetical protein
VAGDTEIISLYRYFLWAQEMRALFASQLATRRWRIEVLREANDAREATEDIYLRPFMSYWLAGMYVVIEGWRKRLQLHDTEIDSLLQSPNVDLLEQFRHGSFHYRPELLTNEFMNFIAVDGTHGWMESVADAFAQWFDRWLQQRRTSGGHGP